MIALTVNLILVLRFAELFPGCSSMILTHYLHPRSHISAEIDMQGFTASTACWAAAFHLVDAGVADIQICEVMRIEAPLSGYLIDATGYWDRGKGESMSIFRVGIHDDRESPSLRGEKFVLLAAGFTGDGEVHLYPEPVLTEDTIPYFMYEYEYLIHREEFLSLPDRF